MPAVKFYSTMPSDDENVLKGISGKIPAEVRDIASDETYVTMSDEEYKNYLDSIKQELIDWKIIQEQIEETQA